MKRYPWWIYPVTPFLVCGVILRIIFVDFPRTIYDEYVGRA